MSTRGCEAVMAQKSAKTVPGSAIRATHFHVTLEPHFRESRGQVVFPVSQGRFFTGKRRQLSGEEIYLREQCPEVDFYQMGTGFTWDTQDRSGDIAAAIKTWAVAKPMLQDASYNLVVLDELTYMIAYDYLPEEDIIQAIRDRPPGQSVVVTGRGGGSALQEVMDTVSEVKEIKHAFKAGIMARKGVDY